MAAAKPFLQKHIVKEMENLEIAKRDEQALNKANMTAADFSNWYTKINETEQKHEASATMKWWASQFRMRYFHIGQKGDDQEQEDLNSDESTAAQQRVTDCVWDIFSSYAANRSRCDSMTNPVFEAGRPNFKVDIKWAHNFNVFNAAKREYELQNDNLLSNYQALLSNRKKNILKVTISEGNVKEYLAKIYSTLQITELFKESGNVSKDFDDASISWFQQCLQTKGSAPKTSWALYNLVGDTREMFTLHITITEERGRDLNANTFIDYITKSENFKITNIEFVPNKSTEKWQHWTRDWRNCPELVLQSHGG